MLPFQSVGVTVIWSRQNTADDCHQRLQLQQDVEKCEWTTDKISLELENWRVHQTFKISSDYRYRSLNYRRQIELERRQNYIMHTASHSLSAECADVMVIWVRYKMTQAVAVPHNYPYNDDDATMSAWSRFFCYLHTFGGFVAAATRNGKYRSG